MPTRLTRSISALVLLTFTSLTLQPLQAIAQHHLAQTAAQATPPDIGEQYAQLLQAILAGARNTPAGQANGPSAATAPLNAQTQQLDALETQADQDFAALEAELIAKRLPAEILARHRAAVQTIKTRQTELKRQLQTLASAPGEPQRRAALQALEQSINQIQNTAARPLLDPHKLPWRTPESKVRPPAETDTEYKAGPLRQDKTARQADTRQADTPQAAGPYAPPSAADLAETEDIQLTPAIRAKAQELGNHPVQIHNWVRNTIEFIPSYGSIQGSDMTLQTKRGNATDTASLEIALLRAAGIPARYVYGTIQLPADRAMNWVGGVSKPEAALNLLAQGGIPSIGLVTGGQISHIKMEHVWVEAWIDYIPSRGAVNKEGDTWIPLDGSYKQYQYTQGMDLKSAVPLDAQNLLARAQQGATVNEREGWVQNLNSANIQAALTNYQTQVKTYIDSTKPNATVGDVLGTKTIQQKNHSILLGTLPYQTLAVGNRMSGLPDSLKWKYRTALYNDATAATLGDSIADIEQPTIKLAGKKITLSFTPATQADTDLINSYLPKPHADGTPIQPSELPKSLPGYLLHLKAEIRVDGQLVSQSATPVTMGQSLLQATAIYNPGTGQWEEGEENRVIAGGYHAIALDLQGTGSSQLAAHKAKLEQFQQNPNNTTPIANLTKEDLSGDLLYAGILGYFASVDGSDNLAARTGNQVVNYRLPSYGTFMAAANPHYWFGIVRSVSFPGVAMDVDRLFYQVEAKDGDKQKQIAYLRQVGAAGSAFEHAVPERLFADPAKPLTDPSQPQGVSAVKAIAIAASQGQKIYTLNASNQAYHASTLAQLQIDADAKQEISDALNAGKEVTVHQAEITVNGWTGSGYIILDPETGAGGAYKISGGANGAFVLGAYFGTMITMELIAVQQMPSLAPEAYLAALWVLVPYLTFCAAYLGTLAALYGDADRIYGCFVAGILAPISFLAFPGGPATSSLQWLDWLLSQIGWSVYSPPTARECGIGL